MGNLSIGLKKFLQNKNTVTVVGVIAAIVVLYFAYTMRIRSSINPVVVPYAKDQISAGTLITESMISSLLRIAIIFTLANLRSFVILYA